MIQRYNNYDFKNSQVEKNKSLYVCLLLVYVNVLFIIFKIKIN